MHGVINPTPVCLLITAKTLFMRGSKKQIHVIVVCSVNSLSKVSCLDLCMCWNSI